jgi:hypothetical protein
MQNNELKNINIANLSQEERERLAQQLREAQAPAVPEIPAVVESGRGHDEILPPINKAEAQAVASNIPSDKPLAESKESRAHLTDEAQRLVDNVELLHALDEAKAYNPDTKSSSLAAELTDSVK